MIKKLFFTFGVLVTGLALSVNVQLFTELKEAKTIIHLEAYANANEHNKTEHVYGSHSHKHRHSPNEPEHEHVHLGLSLISNTSFTPKTSFPLSLFTRFSETEKHRFPPYERILLEKSPDSIIRPPIA